MEKNDYYCDNRVLAKRSARLARTTELTRCSDHQLSMFDNFFSTEMIKKLVCVVIQMNDKHSQVQREIVSCFRL